MTDVCRGTWVLSGNCVILDQGFVDNNYSIDLDNIKKGMKFGIMWKENGNLHFYKDGINKGIAATDVPSGNLMCFLKNLSIRQSLHKQSLHETQIELTLA